MLIDFDVLGTHKHMLGAASATPADFDFALTEHGACNAMLGGFSLFAPGLTCSLPTTS